jgi:hypothetical protein
MMEIMKKRSVNKSRFGEIREIKLFIGLICLLLTGLLSSCVEERPRHAYKISPEELERRFGRIVTVANMPTPDQNGTGDKMGLFRDKDDTFWGVPVSVGENQSLVGCAPRELEEAKVSDTLPSDTKEIIGAANEPTAWRGGTGELKLLLRTHQNKLRWKTINALSLETDSVCWSKSEPVQSLKFYRLVIADKEKESPQNSNSQSNQ